MRYVLDSCVAVKWVLPESDSQKALAIRDDYLNGTHELIAPDVFKVEVNDEDDTLRVTLNDEVQDGSFIAELLVRNGFRVKMLREEEIDLEDVFMSITKGITN